MKRFPPIVIAIALICALMGCGKSSTQPKIDPAGAQAEVDAGNAALASGDYAAANTHYKNAITKNPGNTYAQFGAAVTEVFLVQDDPDIQAILAQYGGAGPAPNPLARAPGDRKTALARRVQALRAQVGGRFTPLATGRTTFRLLALTGDPPAISDIQAVIRTKVMPRLQYAEERLNVVEAASDFVLVLTPAQTGGPDQIEIDKTEIFLLDALVNDVQGWLGLLVAYNFDVPNNDFEHVKVDSLLDPGTDFGKLHTGGALVLASAKSDFANVKTRFDQAVTYLSAETDDQADDLIPKAWLQMQDFAHLSTEITQLYVALSGPVTVPTTDAAGQPFQLQVNLGRFFVPAIPDLKEELPNHTFVYNQFVPDNPLVLPDPTVNGIFPDMTNPRWQQLTGMTGAIAARGTWLRAAR